MYCGYVTIGLCMVYGVLFGFFGEYIYRLGFVTFANLGCLCLVYSVLQTGKLGC